MKSLLKEFKTFISKGNVLDLAVAVVIGTAFSAIVSSLVNDVIMPLVGIVIGNSFSSLTFVVNNSTITYGNFIQAIVNFLFIALCVFLLTKILSKIIKKEEKKEEKPKKTDEVLLLEEIRDLLKKNKK